MSHIDRSGDADEGARETRPPTNPGPLVLAGILLAIPIVALCWVSTYAKEDPKLGGIPFFFWYQFLWVFITAGLTYAAYRIVLLARNPGAGTTGHASGADGEDER